MKTIGLTVLKCACFGNVRSMKEYYEKMDLGVDKEYKIVLKLAVPAMLAQLINVLYSIVDRLYISNMQTGGELALAGIGIVAPICTLITSFSYLIGLGGAPFMSISLGEKIKKSRCDLGQCFFGFACSRYSYSAPCFQLLPSVIDDIRCQ